MSINRIAVRYAKSLIDLAVEQNKLDDILEDIRGFNELVKNRDFFLLLKSPIIHGDKKIKVLDALLEGQIDELTSVFFKIIIKKNREANLPEIAEEFINQYNEIKKISLVKLTTAVNIDESKLQLIKEKIRESGVTYQNIELEILVDPNILGGFVLEFEDKLYDASVLHHLDNLKKTFS